MQRYFHLTHMHISCYTIFPLIRSFFVLIFFFFNDTATTEIYTLSLHDALPISIRLGHSNLCLFLTTDTAATGSARDRKSTRLNSSHTVISYAVFCLKKKKKERDPVQIVHGRSAVLMRSQQRSTETHARA